MALTVSFICTCAPVYWPCFLCYLKGRVQCYDSEPHPLNAQKHLGQVPIERSDWVKSPYLKCNLKVSGSRAWTVQNVSYKNISSLSLPFPLWAFFRKSSGILSKVVCVCVDIVYFPSGFLSFHLVVLFITLVPCPRGPITMHLAQSSVFKKNKRASKTKPGCQKVAGEFRNGLPRDIL